MDKQQYQVTGMTCSACSAAVERAVKKLSGVESVAVNLLGQRMVVSYDDNILSPDMIISAVEHAGYGASLIGAKPAEKSDATGAEDEAKKVRLRLYVSFACLIPLMIVAMGPMLGMPLPDIFHHNPMVMALTQFLLCLPIAIANAHYFTAGFKAMIHRSPNMDSLIAVGSGAALVYGIWVLYLVALAMGHNDHEMAMHHSMDLYFESAGTILTLITLGKYFEARSKGRTTDAIKKLIDLAPKTAIVERDGAEINIPIESVQLGDVAIIKPGAAVSVDGIILVGHSAIDESALTGESMPVDVRPGAKVSAGTINHSGLLRVRVDALSNETALSRIVQLVEEAGASKAPIGRMADRVSAIFVPIVISIAIIATIGWLVAGKDISFALSIGISVLVISCPCALGLATPVAIMVGTGRAAQLGVLFKSAEALETAHAIKKVALDKTGTLTEGKPVVTDIVPAAGVSENDLLKLAASLEKPSEHPLARAVVNHAQSSNIAPETAADFSALAGRGLQAIINGETCYAGSERLMQEKGIDTDNLSGHGASLMDEGKTVLYFSKGNQLTGLIAVSDTLKPTSAAAVSAMVDMGVEPIMITGDNRRAAAGIAKTLGMKTFIAEVLPDGKDAEIQNLQQGGTKVAMIGDGINDAPALTRADVGIAIGAGTDIAIESADIVLMKSDLNGAVDALRIGRSVIKIIKENLFWAFFYNVIGIPLAAGLFYSAFGWKLNPMIGSAAMSLSSVCVVMNALRLRRIQSIAPEAAVELSAACPVADGRIVTIHVVGMMCQHCVRHVKEALEAIEGVSAVVDLDKGIATATVTGDATDQQLIDAIVAEDYEASI